MANASRTQNVGETDARAEPARPPSAPDESAPGHPATLCGWSLGAPQLDGQAKDDVLVDVRERSDLTDAVGSEPVAHPLDEMLGRRRTRGQPDCPDIVEPALLDLRIVVDHA